jgi:hypothetical protein
MNNDRIRPTRQSKSCSLRIAFNERIYDIDAARSISLARCTVRENAGAAEDYFPRPRPHLRPCSVGHRGVERTLVAFTCCTAQRRDIVELANYAYSADNTPDLPGNLLCHM